MNESQESIYKELCDKGVPNILQALLDNNVIKELLNSNRLNSKIKIRETEAFQTAFDFVVEYLKKNRLLLSLDAISMEYPRLNKESPSDLFEMMSIEEFFQDLLYTSKIIENFSLEDNVKKLFH